MAWMYRCEDEDTTLTSDTKEGLIDKVMQHMQDVHKTPVSREQAEQTVNQGGQQAA